MEKSINWKHFNENIIYQAVVKAVIQKIYEIDAHLSYNEKAGPTGTIHVLLVVLQSEAGQGRNSRRTS